MNLHGFSNTDGSSARTQGSEPLGEGGEPAAPSSRRHTASTVCLLPPTYLPMTADQEARAVEARAGLLADADRHSIGRADRVPPGHLPLNHSRPAPAQRRAP